MPWWDIYGDFEGKDLDLYSCRLIVIAEKPRG